MKTAPALLLVASSLPIAAANAQIADIGGVAAGLQAQAADIADLLGAMAFLLGIMLTLAGLLKLRQHALNPNDPGARLSSAFTLVLVGAALVAVPTTIGVGIGSLFGSGTTNVAVDGSLRSID